MYVARADVPHNEETWYEKAFAVANSTESGKATIIRNAMYKIDSFVCIATSSIDI